MRIQVINTNITTNKNSTVQKKSLNNQQPTNSVQLGFKGENDFIELAGLILKQAANHFRSSVRKLSLEDLRLELKDLETSNLPDKDIHIKEIQDKIAELGG